MDWNNIILFAILYLIGCVCIYLWQHRGDNEVDIDLDKEDVSNKKMSETNVVNDFISSSKNFLLVNQLFFTDNYFDFNKFLDFVKNVEEDNISNSDAIQALSLLNLLVSVSSGLSNDFIHQYFFSGRNVLDINEVKRKVIEEEYSGTIADFYEILISLVFHYKKFLIHM